MNLTSEEQKWYDIGFKTAKNHIESLIALIEEERNESERKIRKYCIRYW